MGKAVGVRLIWWSLWGCVCCSVVSARPRETCGVCACGCTICCGWSMNPWALPVPVCQRWLTSKGTSGNPTSINNRLTRRICYENANKSKAALTRLGAACCFKKKKTLRILGRTSQSTVTPLHRFLFAFPTAGKLAKEQGQGCTGAYFVSTKA